MSCSAKLSMSLQTQIPSTETSDFFKQIFFFKSLNSMLYLEFQRMCSQIAKLFLFLHVNNIVKHCYAPSLHPIIPNKRAEPSRINEK